MNHLKLLCKLSFQYWKHHKKRFYTLMLSLVSGVTALYCAALLIRSEKQAVLDRELWLLGDYDLIIYGTDESTYSKIKEDPEILDSGVYYELGDVQSENGTRSHAAMFPDAHSEAIYHMTCMRGRYPESDLEIALDIRAAKAMGIPPYPDQTLSLTLYSNDGSILSENEYTVTGIFQATNENVVGGYLRYPTQIGIETENMPELPDIFFYRSQNSIFQSTTVTTFLQTDSSDINALKDKLIRLTNGKIQAAQTDIPSGRRYAYSYILGIQDTIQQTYGDNSLSSILHALDNGDVIKDFYSGVLMPIFTFLVSVIVILSIIGITKDIAGDKLENYAILRSLGLTKKHLALYILCDFTTVAFLCMIIGLIVGFLLHILMITILNHTYDLKLQYGFLCSQYVHAVTVPPLFSTVFTIILCVEISLLILLLGFIRETPIQMFNNPLKHRKPSHGAVKLPKGWKSLLVSKINLHNFSILIITMIVMSAAVFGYTYFHALADRNNSEAEYEKQTYGLEHWDYIAEKTDQAYMYTFNIENHHDYGICMDKYLELQNQPFIQSSFGEIANRSTRITVPRDSVDHAWLEAFDEYNLRAYEHADRLDDYETALSDAENAMIHEIGYDDDELIYSMPTVGLFDHDLDMLNSYIVAGGIHIPELQSGYEVLLAMSESDWNTFSEFFHVGDSLALSDIILTADEEQLDFGNFLPASVADPVYKQMITTPEGDEVELTSFAFGKRFDIPVTIGGILVLDEPAVRQYMVFPDHNDHGINIFCSCQAFTAWGLPDHNLTKLCIQSDPSYPLEQMDIYWYQMLSDSEGISTHSTTEIILQMNQGTQKIMAVYYSMLVLLMVIAIIAITIHLYTDIRIRSIQFSILRASGMSIQQIAYLILQQNVFYPVIGILVSMAPVELCQSFFQYIREHVDQGTWYQPFGPTPWYYDVPFRYNLFQYHLPMIMTITFIIYLLIILAITLAQIHYLSKQSIIAEIEASNF